METEAIAWNVVLVGRWNRAIFTPDWIAKNLFGLAEGEAVKVEVALDELLPHKVSAKNMAVFVPSGRVIIEPQEAGFPALDAARKLATHALTKLPETPLAGAGYNVRYGSKVLPDQSLDSLQPALDGLITDAGYPIEERVLKRAIPFGDGLVNLAITIRPDGDVEVEFNFHRESPKGDDLKAWLSTPIDDIQKLVSTLAGVLGLDIGTGEA